MIGVFLFPGCSGDGGRSSVVALQGEATNRPQAAVVKSRGGERCGKRRVFERVRCDPMKANESEPLMTCRNAVDDIETGYASLSRDEPGGCLFIGHVVSGMEVARAWVRLLDRTWEPVVLRDDAVVHCISERQAQSVLDAITTRMESLGLTLNSDKTRIMYCKRPKRKGSHEHERFDFLGFTFRPRCARTGQGELFTGFLPAISDDAAKKIRRTIKRWRIHLWTGTLLAEIAREINQTVHGWVNYYGQFYPSMLAKSLTSIDRYLVRWAMRKYKRLKGRRMRAWEFLAGVFAREPKLFAHWRVVRTNDRMVGAV